MAQGIYDNIIKQVLKAAKLARDIDIPNLLQPGLVKEMIIANILGHELIHAKRDADAHAPGNPDEKYEYLTCKEGGSGQLDRMFSRPRPKRAESLTRITRNTKVYIAVFYASDQTKCKIIYEIAPEVMLAEAKRKLKRSKNDISHLSFSIRWADRNGQIVYPDQPSG